MSSENDSGELSDKEASYHVQVSVKEKLCAARAASILCGGRHLL